MQAGDVVVLKSGSPKMTVQSITDGKAAVVWFESFDYHQFGHERTSTFPEQCLMLHVEEKEPEFEFEE